MTEYLLKLNYILSQSCNINKKVKTDAKGTTTEGPRSYQKTACPLKDLRSLNCSVTWNYAGPFMQNKDYSKPEETAKFFSVIRNSIGREI